MAQNPPMDPFFEPEPTVVTDRAEPTRRIVPAKDDNVMPDRRRLLAAGGLGLLGLAGCATSAPWPSDRIVDLRSGRGTTVADLLALIRRSDYTLLGELHDNPHHHVRRGALLAQLGPSAAVVSEHLTAGRRVAVGDASLSALEAAGFDAKGWRWPLHAPLFSGIATAGLPLTGGNVERDVVRRAVRDGEAALPADLAEVIRSAPLDAAGRAALEADLLRGHCGQLPASRMAGMVLAQRARDAAMWLALRRSQAAPAILVAGNGHVRTDYGVAQLIRLQQPAARVLSVGFGETETETGPGTSPVLPYTHLWTTPAVERPDPCDGMSLPTS